MATRSRLCTNMILTMVARLTEPDRSTAARRRLSVPACSTGKAQKIRCIGLRQAGPGCIDRLGERTWASRSDRLQGRLRLASGHGTYRAVGSSSLTSHLHPVLWRRGHRGPQIFSRRPKDVVRKSPAPLAAWWPLARSLTPRSYALDPFFRARMKHLMTRVYGGCVEPGGYELEDD